MKFDILLGALILCIVKATIPIGTVNGNLLKVEEGGSGTENDTLINSIEKINGASKKSVDLDTESSGDDTDDTISESSGSGTDDGETGSGSGGTTLKAITTVSPTFRISTDQTNRTSHAVVVINFGTGASTTAKVPIDNAVTRGPPIVVYNNVQDPDDAYQPEVVVVDASAATGGDDSEGSGVNFTVAIIVGVVVGAILSILIIVFLVYRLRKKDEGSYSLDEPSSAMLTAETDSLPHKGKGEYFA